MDIVTSTRVDAALARIKGVFLEIPGVSLNTEQACHLTGLDVVTCLALLLALERRGFLRRAPAGHFLLRNERTGMDDHER
jgi:DNA-binding IclR family transcriptional regulator